MEFEQITGRIVYLYVIQSIKNDEIIAVFVYKEAAESFLKSNEFIKQNIFHDNFIIKHRSAFQYSGSTKVSFFDPKAVNFLYDLYDEDDYNKHQEELKQKALAKLTVEEKRLLKL